MSKLRFFFQSAVKSAVNASYYKEVLKAPLSSSLKYFAFLIFLILLINIIFPLGILLSSLPKIPRELENFYPENLEIRLENGNVSTNQEEPYYLINQTDLTVVIDTTGTLQELPQDKSGMLITKNKIITREKGGFEERVYNLSQFKESFVVNKKLILSTLTKIKPFLIVIIIAFFIFFLPFIYTFMLIFSLTYVLSINLFPFLISKLLNLGHNFKSLLKISLHAYTLPQVLQIIFVTLLKVSFPPFSFTLFYLAFITTILISLKNNAR